MNRVQLYANLEKPEGDAPKSRKKEGEEEKKSPVQDEASFSGLTL